MNLDELKNIYLSQKERYKKLLPEYRKIYKLYYPEEYSRLKKMAENGELPQYDMQERNTSPHVIDFELYSKQKENVNLKKHANLPANWYDPINLRYEESDFYDKYNFYGWEDHADRKLPHFKMSEATIKILTEMAGVVEFLHDFEWLINNNKAYHFGDFTLAQEYDVSYRVHLFTDSRTVHYEHEDIIITDPCYVMNHDKHDDWERCNYGSNMELLGSFINDKYATADTLYGDWSCTTYNADTKEKIGSFCADAGLVSVFSLAQVKAYNPKYSDIEEKPWCVTLIKDFTGDVTLKVKFDKENSEFIRCVEGVGSINFIGTQTGL